MQRERREGTALHAWVLMSSDCVPEDELQKLVRETILSFLRSDDGREYILELVREARDHG